MNISISAFQVEEARHRGERVAQGLSSGSDSVPPLTATGTASPHRKGRQFPQQSCWSMGTGPLTLFFGFCLQCPKGFHCACPSLPWLDLFQNTFWNPKWDCFLDSFLSVFAVCMYESYWFCAVLLYPADLLNVLIRYSGFLVGALNLFWIESHHL